MIRSLVAYVFAALVLPTISGVGIWLLRGYIVVAAEPTQNGNVVEIANPAIDMDGYLRNANEAARHRQTRRLTEAEFLRMSREPGTILLDARSKAKFEELHIQGAINLSFPDIAIDSIKQTIPDQWTRVLIYCNNNFRNSNSAFAPNSPPASLNLSTFVTLYTYGYKNVYELGPLIDIEKSILPFESSLTK